MAKLLIIKTKKAVVDGREHTVVKGTQYYVTDTSKDYQTKYGIIPKTELKKTSGSSVKSKTGKEYQIIESQYIDEYKRLRKLPQTIPLKDLGFIAAEVGLDKNSVVVDAGLGSGASAIYFANQCKKLTSYEIRDDHIKVAKENIHKIGVKNITVKKKDITKGIDEKNVDLVMLDLPEPWEVIEHAAKSLRVGGFLVNYSPSIIQTSDFVKVLAKENKFLCLKTVEILERKWEVDGRKVRPKSIEVGHSGFITFARKIAK